MDGPRGFALLRSASAFSFFILASLGLACGLGADARASELEKDLTVELHAHLFMEKGIGPVMTGSFNDPLCSADHWTDRFSSMANLQGLKDSHTGITLISIYVHPMLKSDMHASVRAQVEAARLLVAENPMFVLARAPWEARRALKAGKRVLILALEGAIGVVDSDDSIREFIDEAGIRIVAPLHIADDELGGGAFLYGVNAFANAGAFLSQIFNPARGEHGVRINRNGVSPKGMEVVGKLIDRRVWIDLSHAPDRALEQMFPLLRKAGQPLLVTHGSLRRYLPAERAISDSNLRAVAESHGILGLMPSEDMMVGTVVPAKYCPKGCTCRGGIFALATHYSDAVEVLGADSVALGSDYNGGIRHLPPTGCPIGDPVLEKEGYYLMAHTPHLWAGLRKLGAPVPNDLNVTVDAFLTAWEKVYGREPGLK